MEDILNLFLGDPLYDENGRVVERDFGIKNVIAILVVVYIGYSLMSKKVISGMGKGKKGKKGKMKGGAGGGPPTKASADLAYCAFLCALVGCIPMVWWLSMSDREKHRCDTIKRGHLPMCSLILGFWIVFHLMAVILAIAALKQHESEEIGKHTFWDT